MGRLLYMTFFLEWDGLVRVGIEQAFYNIQY